MGRMQIEVSQCSRGHFYASIYNSCPVCAGLHGSEGEPQRKSAPQPPLRAAGKATVISRFDIEEYDKTKPADLEEENAQFDPVVGWLVCTAGPNYGRSYRLHSGTNFMGSGETMDIRILQDGRIGKDKAMSISYDPRTKGFFLACGENREPVHKNGSLVRRDEDLASRDRIAIGASEFMFIAFCGEGFSW